MRELAKKILSFLPVDFPNRLYNSGIMVPPLRAVANHIIRSMIPTLFTIEEGDVVLNRSDVAVSGAIAMGAFENTEVKLFRKTIKPGMNVVDIGANIGYYTLIAAKRTGRTGKVFSFEPETTNLRFLRENVSHNNLDNVSIEGIAISNRTGKQKLFLTKDNKGTHSLINNRGTNEILITDTETLDNILKKYGSPVIDIIKMDIEGAEILAIEGMKETINRSENLVIFTEFYPKAIARLKREPIEYLEILTNLGFSLFLIDEGKNDLTPLGDWKKFISEFQNREFAKNIYAIKMANLHN